MFEGGAILYSLGNFLYQTSQLDFRAANTFDAGADLYQASVGALGVRPPLAATPPSDPAWWEGLLVVARFEQGRLDEIRLLPLSLGGDKPQGERGMPRMATGRKAAQILERLGQLSESETPIQVEDGVGIMPGSSLADETVIGRARVTLLSRIGGLTVAYGDIRVRRLCGHIALSVCGGLQI